jgi:hypothetical protein
MYPQSFSKGMAGHNRKQLNDAIRFHPGIKPVKEVKLHRGEPKRHTPAASTTSTNPAQEFSASQKNAKICIHLSREARLPMRNVVGK